MPLSPYQIKGTFCQHDLALLLLTLIIIWLRRSLSVLSTVKLLFLSSFLSVFFRRRALHMFFPKFFEENHSHLRSEELCSTSVEQSIYINDQEFFSWLVILYIYVSIYQLVIDITVDTWVLFYTLGYRPILLYVLYCLNFPACPWEFLRLSLGPLASHLSVIGALFCCVLSTFLLSGTTSGSGLLYIFSAGISYYSGGLVPFFFFFLMGGWY